ncbi:hypothetical protein OAG68_02515 [bacterium]|nr:hypothetical protein [bacterium]
MDAKQESASMAKPVASANVTFIAARDGGRNTVPRMNANPCYRSHIVVQDASIRHATYDDAGMGNEHYMGVEFIGGPDTIEFDVSFDCTLRFMYHPRVDPLQKMALHSRFAKVVASLHSER